MCDVCVLDVICCFLGFPFICVLVFSRCFMLRSVGRGPCMFGCRFLVCVRM